jgi:tRNA nucleotidyltransferase (CCA-adding enzyme)
MPDYMFLLESRLSPEQRAAMLRVQELSAAMSFNVYLTGGTVRDLITGATLRDLDFTVEGNPSRIARELEKGGAKILHEDERLRHIELLLAGDCEGSIAAARDDYYVRPGTRPEYRWSTIMEDLRRRDFSLNAIAISLNSASRGLLLDPANGLSDIERGEIRALTIHSFTNQPVRLLRALRYAARMGFKLEPRTQEWFALALERDLHHSISPDDAGDELRAVAREDRPSHTLKAWEERGLMEAVHPNLAKRHPDYESIARLSKVREDLFSAGFRPRLANPMLVAILGRLKPRERSGLLSRLGFRSEEIDAALKLEENALRAQKELLGRKCNLPIDAYRFLEKLSMEQIAYLLAESSKSKALSKIRAYLQKWRPLRSGLPTAISELEALGMPRGPKFDSVIEQFFAMQLTGKGKAPEDRTKILRKLSGIKEPPKKKIEEKKRKPGKGAEKAHPSAQSRPAVSAALAKARKSPVPAAAAPVKAAAKSRGKKAQRSPRKSRPARKSRGGK